MIPPAHPVEGHPFPLVPQPNESTCGPTCLHAVYRYHGAPMDLGEVVDQVRMLPGGGTLAVFLGIHALRRGWSATIETLNLQTFDPSWFAEGEKVDLAEKLRAQRKAKPGKRIALATEGYLEFLELGGRIRFRELSRDGLRSRLRAGLPLIAGLSATYLYRCPREMPDCTYDDIRGEPSGHFVVLSGYRHESREIIVSDPLYPRDPAPQAHYAVPIARVINSILLGVLSYDANLLLLEPPEPTPP